MEMDGKFSKYRALDILDETDDKTKQNAEKMRAPRSIDKIPRDNITRCGSLPSEKFACLSSGGLHFLQVSPNRSKGTFTLVGTVSIAINATPGWIA
jgi:hypothetical protein